MSEELLGPTSVSEDEGPGQVTYQDLRRLTHHKVCGEALYEPYPWEDHAVMFLGMGCFWEPERLFWELPFVYVTCVGYMGGKANNPSYEDVCAGLPGEGHTEVVKVVYKRSMTPDVVAVFLDNHNSTLRFERDQYKSLLWCPNPASDVKYDIDKCLARYSEQLKEIFGDEMKIETDIQFDEACFFMAEDRHQQYMAGKRKKFVGKSYRQVPKFDLAGYRSSFS